MTLPTPAVDYRSFRLRRINEPEYRHMWWLLFWPIYWLRYFLIERLNPAEYYHPIHCPLDDRIPFQEWFLIPYMLWMVCMLGMAAYTLWNDVPAFKLYSKFLTISMSISSMIFLLYPSCQNLRPETYPRDNFMTDLVRLLHWVDTSTNVFPSEHAIGSMAIVMAALQTKSLRSPGKITVISLAMILVCLSTVFLKQHSVLDLLAAVPVCAAAWWFTYRKRGNAWKAS